MSAIFGVPLDAAYRLISAISSVVTPVIAIVLLTVAVRLLIMPLSYRALRGQLAQARIAPKVRELRARYRRQPDRLQRELTALYKREGTSVFAGFGPLLAQWPFLSVLYLSARRMHGSFLGVPLGAHWLAAPGLFLAVFAVLAAIGYISIVLNDGPRSPGIWLMPLVTVAFAAFSPLAAGIYLVTTTAWTTLERRAFIHFRPALRVGHDREHDNPPPRSRRSR